MELENKKYPGTEATPQQVQKLANEYRLAADHLLDKGRKREPISRAPFRFNAIHAIELYLNALLLHVGLSAEEIRGLQHNLAKRTELAASHGLRLRKGTIAHLNAMAERREYLAMRYEPEIVESSQINRLSASLKDVAEKVETALQKPQKAGKPEQKGISQKR